jgi:glycogen debranching enzyme
MLEPWLQDLESVEAITRRDDARKIFLRMAALSRSGRMPSFLAEIEHDQELGETTKGHAVELPRDRSFLVAVEEYLRRTERLH